MQASSNCKGHCALFGAAIFGACLSGCLQEDTRPEPGSLLTTVTGSQATREGVTTADGWSLSFDRALVLIGPMQLGDECNKYKEFTEPGYERLLDVTFPDPQKLSIMRGYGTCDVDFKLGVSCEGLVDTVLGAGVSEADSVFMHTGGADPFLEECNPDLGLKPQGVALHVEGAAVQGSRSLRFAWDLRQTQFLAGCSATIDGQLVKGLTLRNGETVTYNLLIEVEALFRDDVDGQVATLHFEPFATADATFGNNDGNVTLEELDLVSLDDLRASGGGPYTAKRADTVTLGAYVYRELWDVVVRFRDTGRCKVSSVED